MAEVAVETGESKTGRNSLPSTKNGMKLSELKVTDLKIELENRGLDKTGVKAALVDRLRKAIEEEGENSDEYVFEMSGDSSPTKRIAKRDAKDLSIDIKQDSENEEEEEGEMYEEQQENRDEVLQLSLDDKEDNIDAKEIPEEMDTSESQDATLKLDSSQNSITSTKENDQSDQLILDSTEDEPLEKSASQAQPSAASTFKVKLTGKGSVKVIARTARATQPVKSIWITNLPLSTRAADLKSFFAKHGKVMLVKIVTNAKQTTGNKKFYGYITMATSKEASKAVQELNNAELNGQEVKLELTTDQPNTLLKKAAKGVVRKVKAVGTPAKVLAVKAKEKVSETKDTKVEETSSEKEAKDDRSFAGRRDRERDHRSRERRDYREFHPRGSFRRPFGYRGRGRGRGGFSFRERPPIESFRRPFGRRPFFGGRMGYRPPMKPSFMQFKIREERQRERLRERSIRESERRRAEDAFRQKLIERKQREEAYRLEREKVQLRIEREMLEREKAEYLKNEREKQRMERERIEREREKLRRQAQMRDLTSKRPFPPSPVDREPPWEKEKRVRHYENRYPSFSEKPPGSEGRPDFREPPPGYRKFEHRPDHYDRDPHPASTSRSDFSKYSKEKADPPMRDHDERRVYKRPYFKEEASRSYPPRELERYPPPPDDRGYKRKMHETMRSPRPRGGGSRRVPYY